MTVHQLPVEAGAFARYLADLTGRIDRTDGWYAIFRRRDPDGLRACLDGTEIPPWDVVESLLHDLAAAAGAVYAGRESARARALHAAAAAAHDRLPGGAGALQERLELMLREELHAKGRAEELLRLLAGVPERGPEAERLSHELAWTRDDHARAMARIAELSARLARVNAAGVEARGRPPGPGGHGAPPGAPGGAGPLPGDLPEGAPRTAPAADAAPPAPPGPCPPEAAAPGPEWFGGAQAPRVPAPRSPGGLPRAAAVPSRPGRTGTPAGRAEEDAASREPGAAPFPAGGPGPADGPDPAVSPDPPASPPPVDAPARRPRGHRSGRRRGGARFAGIEDDAAEAPALPVLPVPQLPDAADTPRGARFGGAAADAAPPEPAPPPVPPGAAAAALEAAADLRRLRAEGRGGEAHVVLCEAAARPVDWLPPLAAALDRAGLAADRSTLLWEVASQPADRVAAAAELLDASGRGEDARQLLRQGVARPAAEIAEAALALEDRGQGPRADALLAVYVEVRGAAESAAVAGRDPGRLVPRLLRAARAVSASRERDLVHALRVAGLAG
ncbi:hypothetical protein NPS70_00775 [Streptomyces sp. C10-9-1]|uniref:hypothetical protein n=1 Tax=Streptomyces sp. C10-9-1 TaxID=1859285 RepID=UPI00211242E1|nr:hypothetical protein [Streptomyces sp. C10-9-1]MCQ6551738.1 hypothetical protein [Streptomyces sp. C10-9-1]